MSNLAGDAALEALINSIKDMKMDSKNYYERGYVYGQLNIIRSFMNYDTDKLLELQNEFFK